MVQNYVENKNKSLLKFYIDAFLWRFALLSSLNYSNTW